MKKLTLGKAQELLEFLKGKAANGDITISQENYLQAMELAVIVLETRELTSLKVDVSALTMEQVDVFIALSQKSTGGHLVVDSASPAISEGYALVPIDPTEHMVVCGFESAPSRSFSPEEVWEAYDEMSGCEQSAHRAKLCWAAMIAAAPKPEAL